jgi:hypothetical protein
VDGIEFKYSSHKAGMLEDYTRKHFSNPAPTDDDIIEHCSSLGAREMLDRLITQQTGSLRTGLSSTPSPDSPPHIIPILPDPLPLEKYNTLMQLTTGTSKWNFNLPYRSINSISTTALSALKSLLDPPTQKYFYPEASAKHIRTGLFLEIPGTTKISDNAMPPVSGTCILVSSQPFTLSFKSTANPSSSPVLVPARHPMLLLKTTCPFSVSFSTPTKSSLLRLDF